MTIRLSRLARVDLEDLRAHTVKTWGRMQWLAYYRQLAAALERISGDPGCGRDRSLFAPGMRSLDIGQHVVFFQPLDVADGVPVVLRIMPRRRNLPALSYDDALDLA